MFAPASLQPLLAAPYRLAALLSPRPPVLPARYRRSFFAEPIEEAVMYPAAFRVPQTVVVSLTKGSSMATYSASYVDPFGFPRVTVEGNPRHFRRADGAPLSLDRLPLESIGAAAVSMAHECGAAVSVSSTRGDLPVKNHGTRASSSDASESHPPPHRDSRLQSARMIGDQ